MGVGVSYERGTPAGIPGADGDGSRDGASQFLRGIDLRSRHFDAAKPSKTELIFTRNAASPEPLSKSTPRMKVNSCPAPYEGHPGRKVAAALIVHGMPTLHLSGASVCVCVCVCVCV